MFADLNGTWTPDDRYKDSITSLCDKDTTTCISKNQILATGHGLLGTLTIYDDLEGTLEQPENTITLEIKGDFPSCDGIAITFVEHYNTGSCPWLRNCTPDKQMNELVPGGDTCYVNCECPKTECSIKVAIFTADLDKFNKVCEVIALP